MTDLRKSFNLYLFGHPRFEVDGLVIELKPDVVAGFERGGSFYTREEAAEM